VPGAPPLSPAWRRGRALHAMVDHVQVAHGVHAQGAQLAPGELVADPVPVQRHAVAGADATGPASCRRARAGPSRWRARPGSAAARPSTAAGTPPRPGRRGFRSAFPSDPAPVQHDQRARPCGRRRADPSTGTRRRRGSYGWHAAGQHSSATNRIRHRAEGWSAWPARHEPTAADSLSWPAWPKGSTCNADTFITTPGAPFRRMPC
jgi:hypothetical protein